MRFFLLWLLVSAVGLAAGVREGMSREEVEAALGRPKSVLFNKDRQVLLYPDGGRVELTAGRLVYSTKVPLDDGAPALEPAGALPARAEPPAPVAPVPSLAKAPAPTPEKDELVLYDESNHQHQLEKSLEGMTSASMPAGVKPGSAPGHFWYGLLLTSLAQLLTSVVVLKFAFAWADVHADWGQMWIPALAETLAATSVRILAYVLWGAQEIFQMDNGVAFFVLLWVLMRTTHACTWQRAATVAMTTKTVGVGVRLLLGALAVHAFA